MSGPFLRNPYLLVMSVVVIAVAGLSAFGSLPRLEDPRILNRFPLVIAPFPGASAERVEALVAEPLENALDEIEEIKRVESTSRAGQATISIEMLDSVGPDENEEVFARVRTKIEEAATQLPPSVPQPRVDDNIEVIAFTRTEAVVWRGDGEPPMGVMQRLAEDLADALRSVPGTELVRLYGGAEEEITVLVDLERIEALGLTVDEVAQRVRAADSRRPAGAMRSSDTTVLVEVDGALDTLERVRSVPLRTGADGSAVVRLGDVAEVQRGVIDPPGSIGLVDGERAVLVGARAAAGVRIGDWAEAAQVVVDEFEARLGGPIELVEVFDQNVYTGARLGELVSNMTAGAVVIMIVILFTMGWRLALLVGTALPLTVCVTLFGISVLGGQIHQMSIFGMIIALGLLIDNAIVVVDEIRKRREEGMGVTQAVEETTQHLRAPLFASTLTTVLAFAPIVLLPGAAGDFVGYIGISVILAVSASFLLSLTVVAALTGRFGRFHEGGVGEEAGRRVWWRHGLPGGWLADRFQRAMRAGLKRPILPLLVGASLPILGFVLGSQLGRSFFPPTDRDMFDVQVWMASDSSIEKTQAAVEEIERQIRSHPEVERVHWLVGGSFPAVYYNLLMNRVDQRDYARGVVKVDGPETTERLVPILQREIDRLVPDAQVVVRKFQQGPPIEADVQYRIFGPSIEVLQQLGSQVRAELQNHSDILHTQVSMPRGEPKMWLQADESEAQLAGLTLTDLAAQLDSSLEGVSGGFVLEDLEQLPLRFRLEGARSDLGAVESLRFAGRDSQLPLEAIGTLDLRPELGGVTRYDGERCNTIYGYTRTGALPIEVDAEVRERLEASGFVLPRGYRFESGGSAEEDQEAVGNLLTFVPVLVTIMMATIILVFRSVRVAGILLMVGGLSVGLALLATWTRGFPVSFNTILGTLGLIGVALNDSIVVLAAIRENPRARLGNREAVLKEVLGCGRHVISTTLTTIGGFLPLLLFIGGVFWPSLAIVLAGGVGGATILAMVFVPAAYVMLFRRAPAEATDDEAEPAAAASLDLEEGAPA
ncbi:MAG: AcrB/AcrD/AcrF family protein [Acidobacteria bacterium]|nr:MAG: AcrB/AcrD/AcrF family protein [Acidobacteriota bacterium]